MIETDVYFARCIAANGADMGAIKIGCSCDVVRRQSDLEMLLPFRLDLIGKCPGDYFAEQILHLWLRADRIAGEYFHDRGEVARLAQVTSTTGKFPLTVAADHMDRWSRRITMQDALHFMEQHGITLADASHVSGNRLRTFEQYVKDGVVPNRRFIAALTVAAMRKGHQVEWSSNVKVAA